MGACLEGFAAPAPTKRRATAAPTKRRATAARQQDEVPSFQARGQSSQPWPPHKPSHQNFGEVRGADGMLVETWNEGCREIKLGSRNIEDKDVRWIASTLECNGSITLLDLSNNKIGSAGAPYIAAIVEKSSMLSVIDLRGNRIADTGIQCLADALTKNTSVTALDLRRNCITNGGVVHITAMLEKNATITSFDLRHNDISESGVEMIAASLESSGNVADINFAHCISAASRERLKAVMEKNRNRHLVLSVRWSLIEGKGIIVTCTTLGGRDIATQTVSSSDTLAVLKAALSETLKFPALQLQLVHPDGRLLEDNTVTFDQLLGL